MPELRFSKAFVFFWFALLIIAAVYIRIDGMEKYHYHVDELMHIKIAEGNNLKQVLQFSLFETHPPLGHFIRYFWQKISEATWFERSLSLIFGLLMIPLYYRIGKELNGQITGFVAATLIAFSNACVIQSYIVRNYTIFLFFLSVSYYFYLLWLRDTKNKKLLFFYFIAAIFTCVTHFSGMFGIAAMALYGSIALLRKQKEISEHITWFAVNLPIGAISLACYIFWNSTLTPVQNITHGILTITGNRNLLLSSIFYIIPTTNYFMPNKNYIYILTLVFPFLILHKGKPFNKILTLSGIAILIGMIMSVTGAYPFIGRRGIWPLPFVIIPAAWMLADCITYIIQKYSIPPSLPISALLIIGLLSYDPETRFSDDLEYKMTEAEWGKISTYLNQANERALFIAGRTDAIMLAPPGMNVYRYLGASEASVSDNAALIPYYHTHMLFDNRYTMRIYINTVLVKMLKDAEKNHILDNYDNLIFINTYTASTPIVNLITCKELDKKIVTFSSINAENLMDEETKKYPVIFLEVKKKDFLTQVLSDKGKASDCLK